MATRSYEQELVYCKLRQSFVSDVGVWVSAAIISCDNGKGRGGDHSCSIRAIYGLYWDYFGEWQATWKLWRHSGFRGMWGLDNGA